MDILRQSEFDRFATFCRLCDDLEIGLRVEHHSEPSQDDRVIVSDEDAGLQGSRHV